MTTRKPAKAPPPFINVKVAREKWEQVKAIAAAIRPRTSAADLLDHWLTQALEAASEEKP